MDDFKTKVGLFWIVASSPHLLNAPNRTSQALAVIAFFAGQLLFFYDEWRGKE